MKILDLNLNAKLEAKRELLKDLREAATLAREIDRQSNIIIDILKANEKEPVSA